ncbi:MAG: FHA domain-containing protein, partial [Candidatus Promineifilaceae bacterium]|nr:FHA domain-containing protein [Candidatus Promineifilaceae bacterium]
ASATTSEAPRPSSASQISTPHATPQDSQMEGHYVQVSYMGEWDPKGYPIGDEPLTVGRLPTSDIVLDRPEQRYVSKRHCEIRSEKDRIFVRDLGSTNGTLLGDEKIQPNILYEWKPDTYVKLGPFTLGLKSGSAMRDVPSPPEPEPAAAPAPTTKINSPFVLCCPSAVPSRMPVLPDRSVVIGRADDCDMVLASPHVSKHHCRVQLRNEEPEIVDLRSTNGTYLGRQRLPAHTPVQWTWQEEPKISVGPFVVELEKKTA